ncbi:hypothetical protein JIN77_16830 [Verrucomicrobiaceae bacterium R5-34]|nr:hypothetical protein [Verrucomicrobiaceae bacterium R5-34]
MKRKTRIVALIAIMIVSAVFYLIYHADDDHYQDLDRVAQAYEDEPTEERLRALLNYPSDGAYAYYHVVLVGEAFSANPKIFRSVYLNIETNRERWHINNLATLKDRVFGYYPEREPWNFDRQIERNQSWLVPLE